jgi:hypothetical protein
VLNDKITSGLFKVEHQGDVIIALASKMYYCDKDKYSSKGLNKKKKNSQSKSILMLFKVIVRKN